MNRIVIATLASALCSWAIWEAARTGIARTLAERAELTGDINSADRAVKLAPNDAEAHFARGEVLQSGEDYGEASVEFERAVQLRSRDYFLWLMLGVTRDENQDQEGALRALRQAVALAPSYAPPRWQLGNLLLRMGHYEEAFAELRRAAIGNPKLWPNVIDLAWGIYVGDVDAVVRAIQPATEEACLSLALFLARHDQSAAALGQFRQTAITNPKSEALLDELLKARAFNEAYEVWARIHGLPSRTLPDGRVSDTSAGIRDGGFEEPITVGQSGFGWQITPSVANVTMSVDTNEHQSGSRSLRIDFRGNSNPTSSLLTQLVLLKPQAHYRLGFAALSKDFVSAAAPIVRIADASGQNNAVLAESLPLRSDVAGWRDVTIDFNTSAQARAIVITIARQSCASDPCPAFGTLWLDSFSLSTGR